MKPPEFISTETAAVGVMTAEALKESVWMKHSQIPGVSSVMKINVTFMKINFPLKAASHTRINPFAAVEESAFAGNVYVTKLNLEKCTENTVKKMTFPVPITMEICVLGMGSVKPESAGASVAGKEIGASVHQRQPSTVSTPRARCAAEEGRASVAVVSAPIPEASGGSVSTAPRVPRPAVRTGIACNAFTLTT